MEAFASNLRKRAEELGLTHAEVARRAGLSERRYGNYVAGTREPDLATLLRIAGALETSPDRLLGAGQDHSVVSKEEVLRHLLPALDQLAVERLRLVAKLVAALS